MDQGGIKINQPSPRDGVRSIVQPLQQRGGRLGHGEFSRRWRAAGIAFSEGLLLRGLIVVKDLAISQGDGMVESAHQVQLS